MPTKFDLRVVRYIPGGARQGVTPNQGIVATLPIDDPGVLGVSVSEKVLGALPLFLELALEYWSGSEWVEPANCRFLVNADDDDDTDVAEVHSLQGVALVPWLLKKMIVQMPDDPDDLVDGHRPFNSATPGAVLKTVVDEAQDDGWAPFLSYDFDADDDSAGVPWVNQLTIQYRPGTNGWVVLKNLIDQGIVEYRTEQRLLRLFNPGTGVDHSDDNPPIRVGRHAKSTPVKRNLDDLLTDVTLFGDNGFVLEVNNPSAVPDLGTLTAAIQQGGVSDPGTAALLAEAQLTKGEQVREQIRTTEAALTADYLPFIDYQVGDWVQGWMRGDWERLRVAELVLSKQLNGVVEVSPVLNDRFIDLLARLARRTAGIVGGAVAGGTGAVPSDPGDDSRAPKAPVGLVVSSTGYWSNDTPLSQLAAEWTAVTEAVDNVAIQIGHYELWARLDDGADESDVQTTTDGTVATWSPYAPLSEWLVKVRAISKNGVPGAFSAEEPVTMLNPTDEVDTPTAPQLTSSNGVVIVGWDGLISGTPPTLPPAHFRQINVEFSGEESGDYARLGTLFIGNQRANYAGLGVGSLVWFRFVGVDSLGRESSPSTAVAVTVLGIDGADILADSITANSLQVGSITVDYLSSELGTLIIDSSEAIVLQAGQIADLTDDLDDTSADLADLRLYVVIDSSEVRITRPGSDKAFALDDERIAARVSGIDISWWEAGQFNVPNLVATVAQIGPMKFETDPDGTGLVARQL